jgi:DNA topoisomerase-1
MNEYITRKLVNNKIKYYNYYTNNKIIKDKELLNTLHKIYIPPAYKDVKIYLEKELLATGVDNAGRKQYIYSDYSKKKREIKKYNQLLKLSENIVKLKKKINNDLLLKSFEKDKIIALILKIMDICNFRCGNKTYEKKYGSYGLTTLHKKHFLIKSNEIEIDFIGKKGVINNCIIKDKNIQDIIKKMYKLSNKKDDYIFSVKNNGNDKNYVSINIQDVNNYLEKFNVTSKDLRTWNANIIFLKNFKIQLDNNITRDYFNLENDKKIKFKKKIVKDAIKDTAISLHHTAFVCKNSYIYKNILINIEKNDAIINKLSHKNIIFEDFLKKLL